MDCYVEFGACDGALCRVQGMLWSTKKIKNHAMALWHYAVLCNATQLAQSFLMQSMRVQMMVKSHHKNMMGKSQRMSLGMMRSHAQMECVRTRMVKSGYMMSILLNVMIH